METFGHIRMNTDCTNSFSDEWLERTFLEKVGHIDNTKRVAQIRLIGTETIHTLLPGHTLDWQLHLYTQDLFKQIGQKALIYINNVIHIHKRQLHIDLGKLRLTVSTKILVTEAFYDLDVAVITGTHQKLLKDLG